METNKLPVETQALTGCNTEIVVDYTDLSDTAGTSKTLTVAVANGQAVTAGPHILMTDFAGPSISSLVYTVGDGDDADHYLTSTEVEVSGTEVDYKLGTGVSKLYTIADTIDLAFTASGANLNTLTAGKLKVYVNILDLDDLK
jgi:hypothetical protein